MDNITFINKNITNDEYNNYNFDDELDYDINNYNVDELINIFKLSKNFDINELNDSYLHLSKVNKENTFDYDKNTYNKDFDIFLLKTKERLTQHFYDNKIKFYENTQKTLDLEVQSYKNNVPNILNPQSNIHSNAFEYNYIRKFLVINSKFRKNFLTTKSNDFIIQLPYLFKNVVSMEFKAMEYCNSVYNITQKLKNNIFYIDGSDYTIPDGNYSNNDIITYLNTILPSDITISLDTFTGKVTVESISMTNFDLSFGSPGNEDISFNMYENFGYSLGFRNFEYTGNYFYTAESILDCQGFRYINVFIDDFLNASSYDNIISVNNGDYFSSKVLARIPNNAETYHIQYQDSGDTIDKIRYYYGPVYLKKLHIRLLDERGNLLENNNVDYSIVLELKISNN